MHQQDIDSRMRTPGTTAIVAAVLALLCLLGRSAVAQEQCPSIDPEVHRLLEAMSSKASHGDYNGVVTLQRGSEMQVMELNHRIVDGQSTQVLSSLTGQDGQVLRAGLDANATQPGHTLLSSAGAVSGGVCGLASSYRFRLGDGERIAGRDAVRLSIEPTDMYRYGYVFELDRDTALMLKATTVAADERVLEQFQFASLSMTRVDPEPAALTYRTQTLESRAAAPVSRGPGWEPTWVPDGFMPTDAEALGAPRKSFTDGLACFSVFVEPLGADIKPGEGVERLGSTVAYTRGVMLRQRPVLITVLGEIPTNTARMVADSVRLR